MRRLNFCENWFNLRPVYFSTILLLTLISCDKKLIESKNNEISESLAIESVIPDEGEMEFGPEIPNPYEISNMKKALKSLKSKNAIAENIEIEPNYKYVRFLPKEDSEYDYINGLTDVDIFEHPLHKKVTKKGNKYRDPELKNSKFGWLYAAVPVDMEFEKDIKMQLIDLLFLPEGNGRDDLYSQELSKKESNFKNIMKELEKESISIFGDEKYNENLDSKKGKTNTWYASGRIRVFDERLSFNENNSQYNGVAGWVPVPGCQVRGNRWFTTKTTITNTDGTFFINHGWPNGSAVDMDIKWDRDDFDIRSDNYGQAYTSNQNITGPWFPNIEEDLSPDHYIYAHAHRAAYKYYYDLNIYGLVRPPSRTFFDAFGVANLIGQKMHLGCKRGNLRSHYFEFNSNWFAAQVRLIFDLSREDARSIYATTIHELAHAAHWKVGMNYTAYCSNVGQAARLAESWDQAVGWHVTGETYGWNVSSFNNQDNSQDVTFGDIHQNGNCINNSDPWYTPLFIDLIDNFNQGDLILGRPFDRASGYTITELQNYLIAKPTNWYFYRDYMANNSNNPTEEEAKLLFSDYDF